MYYPTDDLLVKHLLTTDTKIWSKIRLEKTIIHLPPHIDVLYELIIEVLKILFPRQNLKKMYSSYLPQHVSFFLFTTWWAWTGFKPESFSEQIETETKYICIFCWWRNLSVDLQPSKSHETTRVVNRQSLSIDETFGSFLQYWQKVITTFEIKIPECFLLTSKHFPFPKYYNWLSFLGLRAEKILFEDWLNLSTIDPFLIWNFSY